MQFSKEKPGCGTSGHKIEVIVNSSFGTQNDTNFLTVKIEICFTGVITTVTLVTNETKEHKSSAIIFFIQNYKKIRIVIIFTQIFYLANI